MKVEKRHTDEVIELLSRALTVDATIGIELIANALAAAEHRGASTRALELWAMDVLDAWAELQLRDSPAGHHTTDAAKADDGTVGWCLHTAGVVGGVHRKPKDARIAATRALKAAHPELPDEPKETT